MRKYLPDDHSRRCIRHSRTITRVMAALGLGVLLWVPVHAVLAQQALDDVIEAGRQQFNESCAVCHGPNGKGDGVLGPHLKEQPADLSGLSKANGGTFPFWETYSKIDGREIISSHGSGDMPVWGTDEAYEGSGGRLAMGQILEIVFFLESIQED